MTKTTPDEQTAAARQPHIDPSILIAALKALPPDMLTAILVQSSAAPTTIGMTAEQMQSLIASLNPAQAMREAYRLQRKENPNYPERSDFLPRGRYDDEGHALEPKAKFRRETFFMGVRLGGELETEIEIQLCNRFTEDRTARHGTWKATITGLGTPAERLMVDVPSKTPNDRQENAYPFQVILQELLEGPEAVNQTSMLKRILDLEAELKSLRRTDKGKDAA